MLYYARFICALVYKNSWEVQLPRYREGQIGRQAWWPLEELRSYNTPWSSFSVDRLVQVLSKDRSDVWFLCVLGCVQSSVALPLLARSFDIGL